MNLTEHYAKSLLRENGLPVPASTLATKKRTPEDVVYPVVAKSQVPVGGRGKAGGIQVVDSHDQLAAVLEHIFELDIKGFKPSEILLEEKIETGRELYLSLRLNRDLRALEWMASPQGGVEVEENTGSIVTVPFGDAATDKIAQVLGVKTEIIRPILDGIAQTMMATDLLLCEINPLVEKTDGTLVCADAKITVDDNARFRQPNLPWPELPPSNLKPLGGNIGTIANGAGMAMSTMDTIVAAGGKPANFLDIGGGTGEKQFVSALEQIVALPGVNCVIVNIFAGISRADEIARGIISARKQIHNLPPLFIRLEGTNREIAVELLTDANIAIEPDLKTCVQKALEITSADSGDTK